MAFRYVRPDTSHSSTRNGTSYATAWGGWSEINWASLAAGDTLYVCGEHSVGSGGISIGAHNGALNNRVKISGEAPEQAGAFLVTVDGGNFVTSGRPHTEVVGLKFTGRTSNALFILSAANNSIYRRNTFISGSSTSTVALYSVTGQDHQDVLIEDNDFTGTNGTNGGTALNWFVSTSQNSTLTRVTIRKNRFNECKGTSSRAVVHFRIQNDANVASRMQDIIIEDNYFNNCTGVYLEVNSGFSTYSQSAGIKVRRNKMFNGNVSIGGIGGCMSIWGFGNSTTPGFGRNKIRNNYATDMYGAAGFANVFFGTYDICYNIAKRLGTPTIDGNGVLFDYGNQNCRAFSNYFEDLYGKAGATNSGCGVMVLDSTTCKFYSNVVVRCAVGVYFGNKVGLSTGQSANIFNNTFIDCSNLGVYVSDVADKATCVVQNNCFTATRNTLNSVYNITATWTATERNNNFYGFGAAFNHTLNVSDISVDPRLTDEGIPRPNSPLIKAGYHIGYTRDFTNKQRPKPPSIGAYDVAKTTFTQG